MASNSQIPQHKKLAMGQKLAKGGFVGLPAVAATQMARGATPSVRVPPTAPMMGAMIRKPQGAPTPLNKAFKKGGMVKGIDKDCKGGKVG